MKKIKTFKFAMQRSGILRIASLGIGVLVAVMSFFSFSAQAATDLYVSLSLIPDSVIRGGKASVIPVAAGSKYPISCTVKNVTDNRVLGTYVLDNSNDSSQNYTITNIQSDKTINLRCTDNAGGDLEVTRKIVVNDVGDSDFGVGQYTSETVVVPGGSATLKSSSYQGVFPYNCTYSDSTGWRKQETITQGNKGPANPQSYEYVREITPAVTATYTTDCTDAAGIHKTASVTVTVSTLPVVKLTRYGNGDIPETGGEIQLIVDAELATSCKPSDGVTAWQKEAFSADFYQGEMFYTPKYFINKTTTFSIECSNGAGSSGKKSVTIYVGTGSKCGNGVVDDVNEECDNGVAENSDTCPTTCTTQCKEFFCWNSKVNFVDKYSGSKADILMCSTHDGYGTTRANIRPGATVTYEWDAQNAKTCSRDFNDRLDPPFESCFPIGAEGAGSVSIPVKGSCSITAPTNLPEGEHQSFRFWCDDGAAGKVVSSSFQISRVDGNEAECIPYSNPWH